MKKRIMSRTLSNVRKFIKGEFSGTRLEIMNTKPATKLPDGTPIVTYDYNTDRLTTTQVLHQLGQIDVHAPQVFDLLNEDDKVVYRYEGPSIAQEWKLLANGQRPFYRNMGRA